jgi:hypothetical protein
LPGEEEEEEVPMRSRLVLVLAPLLAVTAAVVPNLRGSGRVVTGHGEQLLARYSDYNLHLAFARSALDALPRVRVRIRGPRDELVYEGVSSEPALFARVPRGTYRVTAEHAGRTETRTIAVDDGTAPSLHLFDWRDAPAAQASAGR